MINSPYNADIAFEIAGPGAMFMRPDTGSTPISYPAPTYSAAKGMFDAIFRLKSIYVKPICVEICNPIRYERFITNYHGPLRKPSTNNYQLMATILVDVCYRIYGEVIVKQSTRSSKDQRLRKRTNAKANKEKYIQEFNKRLEYFQNFYIPCLGWKEFTPNYFGPRREKDKEGKPVRPEPTIDDTIPSMLYSMWESRQLTPSYIQNVEIENGIMFYKNGEHTNAE
jgi:CRISPR-associated protein Cas5d